MKTLKNEAWGIIQFSRIDAWRSCKISRLLFNFSHAEHAVIRRQSSRHRERKKRGETYVKVRLRLTSGSDYEIPSSNDALSPPRCVTRVRMAPLETVSTGAHPLVENTYRRENKLPSYKCHGASRPWSSCSFYFIGAMRHGTR